MNFSMIVYILAWVLRIEGISLLLPFICAIIYREHSSAAAILSVSAMSLVVGAVLTRKKPKKIAFYTREGFVIVAGCWLVLSLVGALPFYISGKIPHYIDAVFEIVSGFTTTGSSILSDVEALGKGLIFWRSFSHWMGGMGVLVLVLTVLPLGGGYNMMIMKAESPGPDVSKMVPRVADTAKALYKIYFVLTVICILAFLLSGMPFFDALCIGFGTAGTGGFAIRNSGMADYSMFSQFLITIFMILFGINFNVYYLLQRRKWKEAFSSEEARTYLLIILCSTLFIAFNNLKEMGNGLLFALHHNRFFNPGLQSLGSTQSNGDFILNDFRCLCRLYGWRYKGFPIDYLIEEYGEGVAPHYSPGSHQENSFGRKKPGLQCGTFGKYVFDCILLCLYNIHFSYQL